MLRLLARAKINWSLDILGKRTDGYHLMDMLMQSVELGDELTLEASKSLSLRIIGSDGLPQEDNLIIKAAQALQNATGCTAGAAITLYKRAPVGAGMGGGSADAAAALIGLNRLWHLEHTPESLQKIGQTVGADVPFLLCGGLARVSGIGEVIRPICPAPRIPMVIVQPCQALATSEAFSVFDTLPHVTHPDTDAVQRALLRGQPLLLNGAAGNVLQQASEVKRPQIAEAVAALDALGAEFAMMTGSGSAVFGAFSDRCEAEKAYKIIRKRWRRSWLTITAGEGVAFL